MAGNLMFSDYQKVNRGRCPCISVLWEEKVAVAVTDFSFSPYVSYYVGKIISTGAVCWGPAQSYATGKWPRIVLINKEDGIYAVEAHNPVFAVGRCSLYHVWKLNRNNNKMEGEMRAQSFHAGLYPRLCANTEGLVVAVGEHQDSIVLGHVDSSSGTLCMLWERQPLNCKIHNNPNLDMSGNKFVITYTKNFGIETVVGEINNDQVTAHQSFNTSELGLYPSISLNSHNQVFLCYQTLTGRKLVFICGKLSDSRVSLDNHMAIRNQTTAGEYPSVCLSNEGAIFVLYKVPLGRNIRIKRGTMFFTEQSRPSNSCTPPNGADLRSEEAREDHSEV